jgi:hypothetical protein
MAENREHDGKICTVQYRILYGVGVKEHYPYGTHERNSGAFYQGTDGKDIDPETTPGQIGVTGKGPAI